MLKISSALVYSWGGIAFNFGGFIFIIPLAQIFLGAGEFNFWLFSSTVLAFGMILESSLTSPITRILSFSAQKQEISSKGKSYNLGAKSDAFFTIFLILIPTSLISFGLVFCLGYLSTSGVYVFSTISYLVIISLTCAFRIFLTLMIGNLHSENKIALQAKTVFFISLAKTLLTVISLSIYKDLTTILILNLLAVIVELFIYILFSRSLFLKSIKRKKFSKNVVCACYSPVINTVIIRIGGYFIAQTIPILSLRLSLEQSTALLLSVKCVSLAYRISLIPAQIKLPKIVQLRAKHQLNEIRGEVLDFIKLCSLVYISSSLFLIGLSFLKLEIAGVKIVLIAPELLTFLIVIIFLEMHHVIHAMVYETTNDVPFVMISLISGALIYSLGIVSVEVAGIFGLLFTQFLVQIAGNNWYSVRLCLRSLNWPLRVYSMDLLRSPNDQK